MVPGKISHLHHSSIPGENITSCFGARGKISLLHHRVAPGENISPIPCVAARGKLVQKPG